jgi:hypothetical protein
MVQSNRLRANFRKTVPFFAAPTGQAKKTTTSLRRPVPEFAFLRALRGTGWVGATAQAEQQSVQDLG